MLLWSIGKMGAARKYGLLLLVLCLSCASLWPSGASANESDFDFVYLAAAGGVRIDGYTGTAKDLIIPPTLGGKKVVIIGDFAFAEKELTSVVIPNSVTYIGYSAFVNSKLTSVVIPNSVTSIEGNAFTDNQLTSVVIPDSVTSIGSRAFMNNELTSIEILGSASIDDRAFAENQLTSVVISGNVTSIGDRAFADNQLTSVVILGSETSIGKFAFDNNSDVVIIGEEGSTAQNYASDERIPFLNIEDPFAFTFEPNGSDGNWDRQATTKVTVNGIEPFQKLQYQWSTESASPPLSNDWISFANRNEISATVDGYRQEFCVIK